MVLSSFVSFHAPPLSEAVSAVVVSESVESVGAVVVSEAVVVVSDTVVVVVVSGAGVVVVVVARVGAGVVVVVICVRDTVVVVAVVVAIVGTVLLSMLWQADSDSESAIAIAANILNLLFLLCGFLYII
jgi:hypothetical protein